jgi:hypothetical protein
VCAKWIKDEINSGFFTEPDVSIPLEIFSPTTIHLATKTCLLDDRGKFSSVLFF